MGGCRGRKGEKKGSRHPLGSREATQEANSPITCRTYRGFAIQASPSNTINIPGRMPGSMLLRRARYATAEEKTIDEWKDAERRRRRRRKRRRRKRRRPAGMQVDLRLWQQACGIMQESFFSDRETRIHRR